MPTTPKPTTQLHVNHRDATGFFEPWLLSMTYTDHIAGQADGLEVILEDTAGRWMREWYPVKGSTLEAWLGYSGAPLLPTGECQVDEIEIDGPPAVVTIRALGAATKKALRTSRSRAYEGKSLRSIAQEIASTHGLKIVGTVPEITWRRATQHRETDLGFLCRLGEEHGIIFSVKGDQLVFHDEQTLEGQTAILKVTPTDLISYKFREKMTVGGASASYFQGDLKELQAVELVLDEAQTLDRHKVRRRTESKSHSQRLAKAALHTRKAWERDGTLEFYGDTRLVAGVNLELSGFGVLDGLWNTRSAKHTVSRSEGYKTELEVRHVAK